MSLRSSRFVIVLAALLLPALTHARETGFRKVTGSGKAKAKASLGSLKRPILQGFTLGFSNGDHKLNEVGVMVAKGTVTGKLADRDRNDPMVLSATYNRASELYHPKLAQKRCRGACTVPVKAAPRGKGWQLALMGFNLRKSSSDASVKLVAIEPSSDRHSFRVEYRGAKTFSYDVIIQYAWVVPSSGSSGKPRKFTGYRHKGKKTRNIKLMTQDAFRPILQGFRVEYRNGAHHVRDIGFYHSGNSYYARLNDNNYDDPVRASAYLIPW
jgi:hypothetical protein